MPTRDWIWSAISLLSDHSHTFPNNVQLIPLIMLRGRSFASFSALFFYWVSVNIFLPIFHEQDLVIKNTWPLFNKRSSLWPGRFEHRLFSNRLLSFLCGLYFGIPGFVILKMNTVNSLWNKTFQSFLRKFELKFLAFLFIIFDLR